MLAPFFGSRCHNRPDPYLNSIIVLFDTETGNIFHKKTLFAKKGNLLALIRGFSHECFRMRLGPVRVKFKVIVKEIEVW